MKHSSKRLRKANVSRFNAAAVHVLRFMLGILLVYPIIWLIFSSMKTNQELFASLQLFPSRFDLTPYIKGWQGSGQYTFTTFYLNSFIMTSFSVVATMISSTLVAYGFARFEFRFKKGLFLLMLSTMMLPNAVVVIPRFILFRNLHWLDTYLPFIVPSAFAAESFFIFMMVQFLRGIPVELDESAWIDGCGTFRTLLSILLPLCKPALVTMMIFKFIWTWNDFFGPLIYLNSVKKYTVSLGLKMVLDVNTSVVNWNQILAMAVVAMIPSILVFFMAQRYFVEGIATVGLKQ